MARRSAISGSAVSRQAVAERLKIFGCCGIYSDAAVALPAATETALGVRKGEFNEVLAASDVLTIHVPLTTETGD